MKTIHLAPELIEDVLTGAKTVEGLLGTPENLKIKTGDEIGIGEILHPQDTSNTVRATVKVTQVLYFESFEELLTSLNYKVVIPRAKSTEAAIASYCKLHSEDDEYEYGVVAFTFELMETEEL
jgi:ASC-1-like (ASCH) protein